MKESATKRALTALDAVKYAPERGLTAGMVGCAWCLDCGKIQRDAYGELGVDFPLPECELEVGADT